MLQIPSGSTDYKASFIARSDTDFHTFLTSLTAAAARYSINGGTEAAMSSPTITAKHTTNWAGNFHIALNNSVWTTLPAGMRTAELAMRITATGMDPVDLAVMLVADQPEGVLKGTASGTPTTTAMISDIGISVDNQLNGRTIIFDGDTATAALRNQATDITSCTASSDTLGFTALTTAPSSGDTFRII